MGRYFLELAYKGAKYSGFQVQENAATIQSEVEKALAIFFKQKIDLTGSSRTDAGVHALQNYFHFDSPLLITNAHLYNINAILPSDIAVKKVYPVSAEAHARFHAILREYKYYIYTHKDPFLEDRAWYYPYKFDLGLLNQAAEIIRHSKDFTSFAKRNTQVNNFMCALSISEWVIENDCLVYHVQGNRFLRGMVRGLVGTMLKLGRGAISLEQFKAVIEARDCTKADFSTPAQGLFLVRVHYPDNFFH